MVNFSVYLNRNVFVIPTDHPKMVPMLQFFFVCELLFFFCSFFFFFFFSIFFVPRLSFFNWLWFMTVAFSGMTAYIFTL